MLQHETGHLDGFLYLDRLIGRHARAAKRAVKSHGWGVPGLSWMPGEVPDPVDVRNACVFAPRCMHAIDRCRESVPALRGAGPGRLAACIRWEELAASAQQGSGT